MIYNVTKLEYYFSIHIYFYIFHAIISKIKCKYLDIIFQFCEKDVYLQLRNYKLRLLDNLL